MPERARKDPPQRLRRRKRSSRSGAKAPRDDSPAPQDPATKQQGIVKDGRAQEQPGNKKRALQNK